jgi:3-deoxy-D-manno-octulosonic-acid transferase
MFLIYNIFIHLYHRLIWVSSFFKPKAKAWFDGRKGVFEKLEATIDHDKPIAWFHCASLGEFEQGRPVIEAFRKAFPQKRVLLTFFSPSGFEIRKNYPGADYIFYLPIDTSGNARKFVGIVNPEVAVFVKYEYWFNYIRCLKRSNIPIIYISAIFRPGQRFFTWYGRWQLRMLKMVDHFFVQNELSAKLLRNSNIDRVIVSGDTRFDRVSNILKENRKFPLIEQFAGDKPLLLAGSTWPADEEIISGFLDSEIAHMKFIFAPHEVHPDRINSLVKKLPAKVLKFSEANGQNVNDAQILVIDSIGILSHLYQYATIAYIGGGFGVGIHNILEAATYGKPVIFGPNYGKFQEAVDLIAKGGAFSIKTAEEFRIVVAQLLNNPVLLNNACGASAGYVQQQKGATALIIDYLKRTLKK